MLITAETPVESKPAIQAQRARICDLEARAEQMKRCWAIQLKVRNVLCAKIPVQETIETAAEFDAFLDARDDYYYRRGRMMELEAEMGRNAYLISFAKFTLAAMLPDRHRRRRVKSTPTKYVRGPGGVAVPRSKSI